MAKKSAKSKAKDVTVPRVCACIMMNHPFPAIIPLLRKIYKDRFSEVRFILPLEETADDDVITVYRGSYNHAAYVTDAYKELMALDCDYYIFIHDDVLLNPKIKEDNLLEYIPISEDEAFIPFCEPAPKNIGQWIWYYGFIAKILFPKSLLFGSGVEQGNVVKYLPDAAEIIAGQARSGIVGTSSVHLHPGDMTDVLRSPDRMLLYGLAGELSANDQARQAIAEKSGQIAKDAVSLFCDALREQGLTFGDENDCINLPFPMVLSGYFTDFYILPKMALKPFAHYIGVASAVNLFVEIIAPTLLYACCARVRTAADLGLDFSGFVEPRNMGWFTDKHSIALHPMKLSPYRGVKEDAFVEVLAALRGDKVLPVDALQFLGIGTALDAYIGTGWHPTEAWGVWASNDTASLRFPLAQPASIRVRLRAPLHPTRPSLDGAISFNGGSQRVEFAATLPNTELQIDMEGVQPDPDGVARFNLLCHHMVSPSDFDESSADRRQLGFALIGIEQLSVVPS